MNVVLFQSVENALPSAMKSAWIYELGFVRIALLVPMKVSSMIEMTLAGLALILLGIHGKITNVGHVIVMYIHVHGSLVLTSRLVDRSRKPVFHQVVDFQVHVKADFKLGKFLKTQSFKVFYRLLGPLSVQTFGWNFYTFDLVTTVEGQTAKSAEIILELVHAHTVGEGKVVDGLQRTLAMLLQNERSVGFIHLM